MSRSVLSASAVRRGRSAVTSSSDGTVALLAALFGPQLAPPAWTDDAACAGLGEWFDEDSATAARLCATCPVAEWCRADQLRWERDGAGATRVDHMATVRGGATVDDRAATHHASAITTPRATKPPVATTETTDATETTETTGTTAA